MIEMTLHQAAAAIKVAMPSENPRFKGVTIDSRKVSAGELFVAFSGVRSDGHESLQQAAEQGASAALVEHPVKAPLPQLICQDSAHALGRLASHWRQQMNPRLVGITGSNGKTTVKQMLASILSQQGPTLATAGNFNNEIGMPLTLCQLDRSHQFAAIEMGAGKPGDIRYLAELAKPDVGLITNAGPAHLERLGTVDNVARVKGELIEALPGDGVVILNVDDVRHSVWRKLAANRTILEVSLDHSADICGQVEPAGDAQQLLLTVGTETVEVKLPVAGRHNARNALCAAAAASALNVSVDLIASGLASFVSAEGRLNRRALPQGGHLIEDSYNANPASVAAAIDVLADCQGHRILVLGDMFELGEDALRMHRELGEAAGRVGLDQLLTLGALSSEASSAFGSMGEHFESAEQLLDYLRPLLGDGVTCLIKGSRGMRMERISQVLMTGETQPCC